MKSFRHVRFSATQGWTLDKKKHPQDWYEVCFKWTEIEWIRYGDFQGQGLLGPLRFEILRDVSGVQKPGRDAVSASADFAYVVFKSSKVIINEPLKVAIDNRYWYEYTKGQLNGRSEFNIFTAGKSTHPSDLKFQTPIVRGVVWYS